MEAADGDDIGSDLIQSEMDKNTPMDSTMSQWPFQNSDSDQLGMYLTAPPAQYYPKDDDWD